MRPKNLQYELELKLKGIGTGVVQPKSSVALKQNDRSALSKIKKARATMDDKQAFGEIVQPDQDEKFKNPRMLWLGEFFTQATSWVRFRVVMPFLFDVFLIISTTLAMIILFALFKDPQSQLMATIKTQDLASIFGTLKISLQHPKNLFYLGSVALLYWFSFRVLLKNSLGTLIYNHIFKSKSY